MVMISELQLHDFRAFSGYRVNFRQENVLVGPNSAGKSTLLTALRFARACTRSAYRLRPNLTIRHRDSWVQAYPVPTREFEILQESVRHEFRDVEANLHLKWKNKASLTVVWPSESVEDSGAYFYLRNTIGNNPRTTSQVKSEFHDIASIPALSPLEHEEEVLERDYVKKNLESRLASRHFRNQMLQLGRDDQWSEFYAFAEPWLGGFQLFEPRVAYAPGGYPGIDFYYREPGSSREKEVVWAGDGFQIWVQLLLHLYRNRSKETILLDEPEVFLHPDLQRRLMRLLSSLESQYVLATHSAEVLAEVDRSAILWVDKSRTRAVRDPREQSLEKMNSALGSSFNLALARVLRAKGVLFVEGEDVKVLRSISKTLRMNSIIDETQLAVVPINGFSNWHRAENFGWLSQEFFDRAVAGFVILDRDYRTDSQVALIEGELQSAGIVAHTWSRKEIESYLLVPEAIARISKAPASWIQEKLELAAANEEHYCFGQLTAERIQSEAGTGKSHATITQEAQIEFTQKWRQADFRLNAAPPKRMMSWLNGQLQAEGHKAVSFDAIAKTLRESEIATEVRYVLERIEDMVK
jgi:energy-coupling factor transporter ATP-binding protein EcfA2